MSIDGKINKEKTAICNANWFNRCAHLCDWQAITMATEQWDDSHRLTESHTVLRACHSHTQVSKHLSNTRPSKCSLNDSRTILSSFHFTNDSLSVYIRTSSVITAKKSEEILRWRCFKWHGQTINSVQFRNLNYDIKC